MRRLCPVKFRRTHEGICRVVVPARGGPFHLPTIKLPLGSLSITMIPVFSNLLVFHAVSTRARARKSTLVSDGAELCGYNGTYD